MSHREFSIGNSRQDESLRRIVEQIGSELDLPTLLAEILQSACLLLDADEGFTALLQVPDETLVVASVYGKSSEVIGNEISIPADLVELKQGEIAKEKESAIFAPILWRDRLVGVFHLKSSVGRAFEPEGIPLLGRFASHAAIAIENSRLISENERATSQTAQVLKTMERIGNAMSVSEVVTAYLEQVAEGGRYTCTIVLYELDEAGSKIGNVVRGRWSPGEDVELLEYRVPAKKDALDPILAAGKTVRIANALTDSTVPQSLREEQLRDNRPAIALVPLMADRRRIGLVILSDPEPHEWTDEELTPYQTTAAQLASVLASRRDHDALVESSRKIAVMEERRKIARDLHDSVTQVLFSLNLLSQTLEPGEVPPNEIIDRLNQLSRRGLQEMRSLLEELRPIQTPPKVLTLGQRIQSYAESIVALPETLLDDGGYRGAAARIEEQLLGIACEALNNVAKHAQASYVRIHLRSLEGKVMLTIEDNGIGLKPLPPEGGLGLGLTSMRERASEIGAKLCVESVPGKGTTIEVLLEGA